MSKYLPNLLSFMVGGFPYLVRVKPATKHATFLRELRHCQLGEEGECAHCANANAGRDAGLGKFCISTDSRFIGIEKFVKTKKYGMIAIGTIWEHKQGAFQKKFDENKKALLSSEEAVAEVTLYPYRTKKPGSGPSKKSGVRTGKIPVRKMRPHGSVHGSLKRAQRSGLFLKSMMRAG